MKTIVTHVSPDEDAIFAVWLVKRFFPGWQKAVVKFVPAGSSLNNGPIDQDPNVIHVDTGLGQFDHHQTGDRAQCAATLVFNEIKRRKYITNQIEIEALTKVLAVVLDVDHAGEKMWPQPLHDRYEFFLESILDGLKSNKRLFTNEKIIEFGLQACEGIFRGMKQKAIAVKILKEGEQFDSPWGRAVGVETRNDAVMSVGERMGFTLVVKKDPQKGNVRIYVHPAANADLTPVHDQIIKRDPASDWFLHASKRLLLNGSSKNPNMRPTKLSLKEVIEIIRKQVNGKQ